MTVSSLCLFISPFPLGKESQRPMAHECLGEVLRVLRQVINTYPLLNTVEILTAAGKLISKVKGQWRIFSSEQTQHGCKYVGFIQPQISFFAACRYYYNMQIITYSKSDVC